jgi:DNA-binding FadR family transcriptional regulator
LECNAAGQAARRITTGALKELAECLQELHRHYLLCAERKSDEERLPAMRNWMVADLNFHMALLHAARNQAVIKTLTEANVLTRMFGHRTDLPTVWKDSAFVDANYAVHREIFEAVCRHDAKGAKRAMAIHMNRARKNILARFDWLQEENAAGNASSQDFPESMRKIIANVQQQSGAIDPLSDNA